MANYVSERENIREKHRVRRGAIIAVAAGLMQREGIAACTVRAVAREASVSAGVIHYYFSDTQELVDLGYEWITDRYFNAITDFRGTHTDPTRDFWHIVAAYIEPWNAHPRMTLLWSEYFVMSGRNQRTAGLAESHRRTISLFTDVLTSIDVDANRAIAVWRLLSGFAETRLVVPVSLQDILDDVAQLTGLPSPDIAEVLCARESCWCRGGLPGLFPPPPP